MEIWINRSDDRKLWTAENITQFIYLAGCFLLTGDYISYIKYHAAKIINAHSSSLDQVNQESLVYNLLLYWMSFMKHSMLNIWWFTFQMDAVHWAKMRQNLFSASISQSIAHWTSAPEFPEVFSKNSHFQVEDEACNIRLLRVLGVCIIVNTSKVKVKVTQSHPTLCDPTDYILHGNSPGQDTGVGSLTLLQGIRFSQPRDPTQVCHIAGGFFTNWATREAQEYRSG